MTLFALYDNPVYHSVLPEYDFAQGFIFAVASSPDIPMPEEWMPKVIRRHSSQSQLDAAQVDELATALMSELRDSLNVMRQGRKLLPSRLQWEDNDYNSGFCQWLCGLMEGHHCVEHTWQFAWDKLEQKKPDVLPEMSADLTRCIKLFTTLAKPTLSLSNLESERADALRDNFATLANQVPNMLKDYVKLAGVLAEYLPNQFETFVQSSNTNPHT